MRIYLMLALCLVLGACANACLLSCTTENLSYNSETKLKNITFDKTVLVPEKARYYGSTQTIGSFFGPIGGLFALAAMSEDQLIVDYMKNNEIDIGNIVIQEFEHQIIKHPRFLEKKFVSSEDGYDAKFIVEVQFFGLIPTNGFSTLYRPVLGVRAKLVSANGEKLWEAFEKFAGSDILIEQFGDAPATNSGVPSLTFEEYFSDPKNMKEAYQKVSEFVVALLMSNI